ncbi:hypothetical protein L228DRAFT_242320 [Xylona heveae TC161]|uniref:GCN5-related N-acetyltransferase Rv2170-like domain-containing protein n=1 Tax=Xylona heveae (strain CBS 132557 / TC161) TaxID=1328760 RepID=A0A165J9J0_XYLHT|nr:hypothetical protein L228DRAFT_242320 [Xylona heveae TC161]KZF25934.1 hypothetical protein L228DRAFT_242320 [Xylona heveae TC161]
MAATTPEPSPAGPSSLPRIYFHPPSGSSVLPLLKPLLPYSLTLLRRIQFHARSPHSYILASFPPPLIGRTLTTEVASTTFPLTPKSLPSHFVIAFVDRSRGPETEMWFFTSLELPEGWKDRIDSTESLGSWDDILARAGLSESAATNEDGGIGLGRGGVWGLGNEDGKWDDLYHDHEIRQSQSNGLSNGAAAAETQRPLLNADSNNTSDEEAAQIVRSQLLSLFKIVRDLPPSTKPDVEAEKAAASATLEADGVHISSPNDTSQENPQAEQPPLRDYPIILVGAIHARNIAALKPTGIFTRYTVPNHKYLFHIPSLRAARALPDNLEFGPVREQFFPQVRSRTAIARLDRTLRICQSLGVYEKHSPSEESTENSPLVAWAFLGPDSSIMSLTTEKAYRGRGLAKALTVNLISQKMSTFGDEPFGHSDVTFDNETSIRVARSLGGVYCWTVYWAEVDLERI